MPFWKRIRLTLEMIKFEHSVFALPFALTGAFLTVRELHLGRGIVLGKLPWIVLAMVGARSAAMTFNRILDARIDARNPRTRSRHIPAGILSPAFAWGFVIASSAALGAAAWMLNPLCFALAPVALAVVFFYSFTKRFTSLSHLVLGFSLGMAPAAAWIAMAGTLDARILWLTAAVTFWTAVFSIPRRFGIAGSLWIARVLHTAMVACLILLALTFHLGWLSLLGVAAIVALLAYEHSLVKADDLSRVNAAFFTVNGYVSVLFFLFWAADIYAH